jgi:hypothetical protein
VGHSQSPLALVPGQLSGSRRWHPGCCRCLLKGCGRWFLPHRAQARYCGPVCQQAARRWRRWMAGRRYRATDHGQQHRRDQARRYRSRVRLRSSLPQPTPPTSPVEPSPPALQTEPAQTTDPPRCISVPGMGQRLAEMPGNSCGLPCHRPGCYVLFHPAVRSLDQKFCSGLCRRALRRVRQREARLRHRRRRGARPLRSHHHGSPQPNRFMSSHY